METLMETLGGVVEAGLSGIVSLWDCEIVDREIERVD